jgi:hypothetical protein
MQTGDASGEIRHRVLQGQPPPEGLSQNQLYLSGVRVSAKKRQETRREDMDELPACNQCVGNEADHANDPRVESSETNLCQPERTGQAIQPRNQRLDELLQPLLQVSTVSRLYDHLDRKLVRWAQRKYRKLAGKPMRAQEWLQRVVRRQPRLFVHWLAHGKVAVRTMGAV